MKRRFVSLLGLGFLLLLTHCPPPHTTEPTVEPAPDAAPLPLLGDASTPIELGVADASTDASDAALAVTDAAAEAASTPVCTKKILGQTLNSGRCANDSECQLRTPHCCGPCGMIPPDRLRATSIHDDLQCAGMGCGKCASLLPGGFTSECVNRRCAVVQTRCEEREK